VQIETFNDPGETTSKERDNWKESRGDGPFPPIHDVAMAATPAMWLDQGVRRVAAVCGYSLRGVGGAPIFAA
jgi:hypothetical protein